MFLLSILLATPPNYPKCGLSQTKCSWEFHCLGDPCQTYNDCDLDYICTNGVCSELNGSNEGPVVDPVPGNGTNGTVPEVPNVPGNGTVSGIPKSSGTTATLTVFDDNTTQCYGSNIPSGNGCAVNPLLLGFTEDDWSSKFSNASPENIPWCKKTLTLTALGKTFKCTLIDTCDPVGNPFNSNGQIVGGKCDYPQLIDLYTGGNSQGLEFIQSLNGDDFYQGPVNWSIS